MPPQVPAVRPDRPYPAFDLNRSLSRLGYRPFHTGARRSANAVAPSRASSDLNTGS